MTVLRKATALSAFCALCALCALPVVADENDAAEDGSYTLQNAPVKREIALQCAFENECFEAESCADTTLTFELKGRAGGLTATDMAVEVAMVSEIGDATLIGVRSGRAMSLSGGAFDARHLLTIAQDGAARYTLHYADGPMVITYLGACE